jgi:exopolysaccharide biosynthesis polyprenyl glycosylphosphotransferase
MNSNGLLQKHWVQVTVHFLLDAVLFKLGIVLGAYIVGFLAIGKAIDYPDYFPSDVVSRYWWHFIISGAIFSAALYIAGLYTSHSVNRSAKRRFFLVGTCLLFAAGTLVAMSYFSEAKALGRIPLALGIALVGIMSAMHHAYLLYSLKAAKERVGYIITCPFDEGEMRIFSEIGLQHFSFVGTISALGYVPTSDTRVLGTAEDLERIARDHRLDRILVTGKALNHATLCKRFCQLRYSGVTVMPLIIVCEELDQHVPLELISPEWLLNASGEPQLLYIKKVKRLFDIIVSVLGLIFGTPILFIALLGVKLTSRGPAIYRQRRSGRFGREFEMIKLRTMRTDAEAAGIQWAQGGANGSRDPRVTLIGGFLRKYRIDEIPQLWNVLKGDMSFVGPRPERPEIITDLAKQIPYYEERMMVQPGITGWAQVNYPYGASVMDARRKLEYDLYYLKHMSLFLDVFILLDTVRTVIFGGAEGRVRKMESAALEKWQQLKTEDAERPTPDAVRAA